MSKIAIISDIHANADALRLVISDAEKRGCNKIICIGDIVTKFYQPAESVDIVRSESSLVIIGNCDYNLIHNTNYKLARHNLKKLRFSTGAHVKDIIRKLEKERGLIVRDINGLEYLENLPDGIHYLNNMNVSNELELGGALIRLYHSNPQDLVRIFNPLSPEAAQLEKNRKLGIRDHKEMFLDNSPQTTIVGHTHEGYIGFDKGGEFKLADKPREGVLITDKDRAVINVGSAGENIKMDFSSGTLKETILPSVTYATVDDQGKKDGSFVAQIVEVPLNKYTHKSIFDGFVNAQTSGAYAYSPQDTRKLGYSIIENNPGDEKLKEEIEKEIAYNDEVRKNVQYYREYDPKKDVEKIKPAYLLLEFVEDANEAGIKPGDPEFDIMVNERNMNKEELLKYYDYLAELDKKKESPTNTGIKKR